MSPAKKPAAKRLWKCPECGHRFVTRNMWHSCGRFELDDHFEGCAPDVRRSFDRLCVLARQCGPVTIYPQKTRITIMHRVRFGGGSTRKRWFDATLWLKRKAEHPLLSKVEDFGRIGCVLHFKIEKPEDLDEAFVALLRETYTSNL